MRVTVTDPRPSADPAPPVAGDLRFQWLIAVLAAFLPLLVVLTATVDYTGTDAYGTLLVSEQILDNGTITLDAYDSETVPDTWHFIDVRGSTYYFYPLGASLFSLPVVALAKARGVEVSASETGLQTIVAALLAAATVLLMYGLARYFVRHRTALFLALAFWFGSSLASTNGTALWSHDFGVVFALVALIGLVSATTRGNTWAWIPLGAGLFCAYLSRPTFALLAVLILPYALWKARRVGILAIVLGGALLLGFMAFSMRVYGTLLPPYYEARSEMTAASFGPGLAGVLFSPSRGLLVYMPIVVMIPVMAAIDWGQARRRLGLLTIAVAWPVLQILMIATWPMWYGGVSFGPRLLVDAMPGLFLATVLVWPASLARSAARVAVAAWVVLAAFGIYVHTAQGLYNPSTYFWNRPPERNTSTILWDWRYPQFLHSDAREVQRQLDYANGGP